MKRVLFVAVAVLGLTGFGSAWVSMRQGIGLSPDSAYYLGGARSLLASGTFAMPESGSVSRPITWYPPFYSAALAAAGIGGIDPQVAARPLHACLLALNLVLLALLAFRLSGRSATASLLAGMLALAAPSILQVHTMIWSEALYLALCIGSGHVALSYAKTGRLSQLFALALLVSGTYLTRYVALVNIGLLGLFVVVLRRGSVRDRAIRLAVLALGLLPVLAWMVRNRLCGADAAGRPMGWHPYTWQQVCDTLTVLGSWALPWRFASAWSGLVVLLAVVALLAWSAAAHCRRVRSGTDAQPAAVWLALVTFVPAYTGFVILTISVAAASSSLDDRLLTPVLLVVILVSAERFTVLLRRCATRTGSVLLAATSSVVLACAGLRLVATVRALAKNGQGYAVPSWTWSPTLEAVRRLSAGALILSNAPDLLYLHTRRPATLLPTRFDINTLETHGGWKAALHDIASREDVVFVWMDRVTFREALPAREDVIDAAGNRARLQLEDGVILAHAGWLPTSP